jgi:hypothetical protein
MRLYRPVRTVHHQKIVIRIIYDIIKGMVTKFNKEMVNPVSPEIR